MNLNKQQQQSFTQLTNILKAIRSVTEDPKVVAEKMQPWMDDFENTVGADVKVRFAGPYAAEIALVDCSRDSLVASLDAAENLNLRARTEGIRISVAAAYKDQYRHSNEAIAYALEALARELRSVPFQIIDKGACDIHEEMGVQHSGEDQGGEMSDEQPVAQAAADVSPSEENTSHDADSDAGVINLVQIPGEADPV